MPSRRHRDHADERRRSNTSPTRANALVSSSLHVHDHDNSDFETRSESEHKDDFSLGRPHEPECCELCGRSQPLTFHHLIPRAVHRKPRFKAEFTRREMNHRGLWLCTLCHQGIHCLIPDEKELARSFNTREALLAHPGVARHVAWAKKQK
ncbi:hypothetical protein Isop_1739 [Isosphaera pallida ATCC 43644]|uniref:HNH domain-containing protein n=1 Tax=Isosphaera pallida (strain ATCC 43644 / DSM 9630 / IS1B) TaxID=575540 RepID=E8R0X6_ISOPI|nr:hypothetical protein [Isosphaera pallida]ADV62322.1 hypothetical protein Isop_1739 [Isosphaera pallida ATCC 43644]